MAVARSMTGAGDGAAETGDSVASAASRARLRQIVDEHHATVWRCLSRFGVGADDLEDGVQHVFWIASRKLDAIAVGSERGFLLGTAVRVAADARRSKSRRREMLAREEGDARGAHFVDPAPQPDEVAEQRRRRAILDDVLDTLPIDLRAVFVLFELEELSTHEIAAVLEIPRGTVASRLLRAREAFERSIARRKIVEGAR